VAEYTTVTGNLRRVGRFDFQLASRAVKINRPTELALNFLDYISFRNKDAANGPGLTTDTTNFIARLETQLGVPVRYAGVGSSMSQTLVLEGGSSRTIDLSWSLKLNQRSRAEVA
jgi:adenylosuccinate synthase